jgi:hypothetical protein
LKRPAIHTPVAVLATLCLLAPSSRGAASNAALPAVHSSQTPASTLNVPNDTLIFAKLSSRLDTKRSNPGDHVEAEITEDVKVDHQTVIKRGSRVTGQVAALQANPPPGGVYGVDIVFENVQTKTGQDLSLHMVIRAIAPPPDQGTNAITDLPPGFDGHANANLGAIEELTAQSEGAMHLPGMDLTVAVGKGTEISILSCKDHAIRLERGTQIVFRVVNAAGTQTAK